MSKNIVTRNTKFKTSLNLNIASLRDYYYRMEKICLAMFEWVDLPDSMNAKYLEKTLYFKGKAVVLELENMGLINTQCATSGDIDLYDEPTSLNCYSNRFNQTRQVYKGIIPENKYSDCVEVYNNYSGLPTIATIELFATRLAECDRICDVNINAQKTPVTWVTDDKTRLSIQNTIAQYEGNEPFIVVDKNYNTKEAINVLKTDAPFIADKIIKYKKEIWNEFLTFIGVNNVMVEKAERLISAEANQNNELINLNLQALLTPRQEACRKINERYGTNISVRVRSDLYNVLKREESVITDYNNNGIDDNLEDGDVVDE